MDAPATALEAVGPPSERLPVAWLCMDGQGRVRQTNTALCALLQATPDALTGQAFDALLSRASRVIYQSYLQPLLRLHGDIAEFALSLEWGTSPRVEVLLYSAKRPPPDESLVDVVLVPIRQRRRIEDEMLRIKQAADQAPGVIFQLMHMPDGRYHFAYVSEVVRRLYEVTADQARADARRLLDCIDPEDRSRMAAEMREALAQGSDWRSTYRVHLSGPALRWHELQASSRRLADGVVLWHGHVADVTRRREMEQALADRQAMERLHRERNGFLARVSHELRTPLNGILGFAHLLAREQADNLREDQRDRLEVIRSSGAHLLQLINEILEITAVEAGAREMRRMPLPVAQQLSRALRVVHAQAVAARVQLMPGDAPAGLGTLANEQRLHQVLVNLLSNAIKYNRPGGHVRARAWREGAWVHLAVTDSGRGLSAAQQAELFQPFNRLGAEQGGTEGFGLGLVITRNLVDAMGGQLSVHSELGLGSTFTVQLPAAELEAPALPHALDRQEPPPPAAAPLGTGSADRSAAPAAEAADAAEGQARGRVIYAEDNEVNALLMQAILGMRPGLSLMLATDAATALSQALAAPPDLLLIDMHLPDATGSQLLMQLREHPLLRKTPAIVVSASARRDDIDSALAQGFDGYWTKPLDVEQTLRALDELLGQPRDPAARAEGPLLPAAPAAAGGAPLPAPGTG